MSIPKTLAEITEQDLVALIPAQVREGKRVEYKDRLEIKSDEQKRKFLASIASFANAAGGDIVFGMRAKDGVPEALAPLQGFNPDKDSLALRDIIRAHIDPPLAGVEMKEVAIQGGYALVIRVARSWAGAHMVTYNDDNRFYTREANGRVLMNVPEIRASFSTLEMLSERIRRFRFERLSLIRSGEIAVAMDIGAKLVLHALPLQSFEPGFTRDILRLSKENLVHPLMTSRGQTLHDLDGFYVLNVGINENVGAYTAILRNGCIESVRIVGREQRPLANPALEESIMAFLPAAVNCFQVLEIQPPVLIMVAILDVAGYTLFFNPAMSMGERAIKASDIVMHEVLMSDFTQASEDLLRPFCDGVWQACGLPRSRNFEANGKWQPIRWEGVYAPVFW